jgi:hypothetical protein
MSHSNQFSFDHVFMDPNEFGNSLNEKEHDIRETYGLG